MKSPAELKIVLRRQWESAPRRESRLLGGAEAWPVVASIGRPKPKLIASDLDLVRRHVEAWRNVSIGEVVWKPIRYRAASHPVDMPVSWKLRQPSEWIAACADRSMREEFERMAAFVEQTDACFHSLLIRQRSLWRDKPPGEVAQGARLAMLLEPRCAKGRPLRTLSIAGIDTKFLERNARLVTALLDVRFDGEVSRLGLETFLGAVVEGDHWLLLMDLDGSLLPFRKLRVRASELKETPLPGRRLLIIENERCQHQLPNLAGTIAVLGAGFDLGWTAGNWLKTKQVGYWGDIDTWGLLFLAAARQNIPHLEALLMTPEIYQQNIAAAVVEPIVAAAEIPAELNAVERQLYTRLLQAARGRLEQEFLPESLVHSAIHTWCDSHSA